MSGISAEARAAIDQFRQQRGQALDPLPAADDVSGWAALQAFVESRMAPRVDDAIAAHHVDIVEASFDDMPALRLRPAGLQDNGGPDPAHAPAPLVFLHGGGYTTYSARSSLPASLPLAAALGREVLSLDYTLAPTARVDETVPAVTRALQAILRKRGPFHLAGDSAGGGLAVAATLAMISAGGPRPESVSLFSPWLDLAGTGDSRETMAAHDPMLRWTGMLDRCAAAYAGDDPAGPAASPLNTDFQAGFKAGFPATLIICGTREILLSDSLRLHHRLRAAGHRSVLRVFDGLYHSFPVVTPGIPEADEARAIVRDFIDRGAWS